ncbi:MAG: hypothetical protein LQ349_003307 [Xanthoria aureola]|nr:MAG: hypothetical protein LQ349_003307 [Xanthoria aureola]
MPGEPLAGYVAPDRNISVAERNRKASDRTGDIVLYNANDESHLDSAVLGATILRSPGSAPDAFLRFITDTAGKDIGYMNMERPVPDPDTLFRDLSQDPWLDTFPTGLRSALDIASLIPTRTESCGTVPTQCILIIPSADVFYFGPEPTNTGCLSAITSPPPTPTPTSVPLPPVSMNPSSVYVVYQPAHIFDYCGRWQGGVVGSPVTMSYPSGVLSSLQFQYNAPPATKAIDFADLSCPPSEVAKVYDPGAPYFPILKAEFGVRYNPYTTADDPLVRATTCEIAAVRDPPVRAVRVDRISGANDGGGIIP